jgi:hypothetical protein
MPIHYLLYENNLGNNSGGYAARVVNSDVVSQRQFIDEIERRSAVNRADISRLLEISYQVIVDFLREGKRIDTDLASYGASIKGTFTGPGDRFSSNRHTIIATAAPGARLREVFVAQDVPTRKQPNEPRVPYPETYFDFASERTNEVLTPGQLGELMGHRLKFNPDDPSQGLFIIEAETSGETRVAVFARVKPRSLIFMVPPDLPPGGYLLEVRAQRRGSAAIRRGRLPYLLQVS